MRIKCESKNLMRIQKPKNKNVIIKDDSYYLSRVFVKNFVKSLASLSNCRVKSLQIRAKYSAVKIRTNDYRLFLRLKRLILYLKRSFLKFVIFI